MIPRAKLASAGPEFSRLAYGTWRLLDDGASVQEINRRLNRCVELGLTTIDTAEIYGLYRVEAALGAALALSPGLREKVEIVTKAGIYVPNPLNPERSVGYYDASDDRLCASVEQSLRHLGTDRVDLFLVHRPDWFTAAEDTARGLNRLLRAGKIRSAGVSNYNPAQFDTLNACMAQPLVTNQVEYHLLQMEPIADGTLDQCQRRRIRPMAWSPLAGGRIFDPANPASARLAQTAAALAGKYDGATLEQLAYAWVMAHPVRPVPIVGTNKIAHIETAARAAALSLEREDWYALWVAARGGNIP